MVTATSNEPFLPCYTIIAGDSMGSCSLSDFKTELDKASDDLSKVEVMKRLLIVMASSAPLPSSTATDALYAGLIMSVLRFIYPASAKCKILKKLSLLFLEMLPKVNASSGSIKQELILACNALRNDLQSSNEWVRGITLRFLCKISSYPEILEPLLPSLRFCLDHRIAYVRRNALVAFSALYEKHPEMLMDAPELIGDVYIWKEADSSCKAAAFDFLASHSQPHALAYFDALLEESCSDNHLLGVVMTWIRKQLFHGVEHSEYSSKFINFCTSAIKDSAISSAIKSQAAFILLQCSTGSKPESISALISLAINSSETNFKILILERLSDLCNESFYLFGSSSNVFSELLQLFSQSSSEEVKKAALKLCFCIYRPGSGHSDPNAFLLLNAIRKDLSKPDCGSEMRGILVACLCDLVNEATYSQISQIIFELISEFDSLTTSNDVGKDSGEEKFAMELTHCLHKLGNEVYKFNSNISEDLFNYIVANEPSSALKATKNPRLLRTMLWTLGRFANNVKSDSLLQAIKVIKECLGPLPILATEQQMLEHPEDVSNLASPVSHPSSASRRILPDGTYATETAVTSSSDSKRDSDKALERPSLRHILMEGNYLFASVLSSVLLKIFYSLKKNSIPLKEINHLRAEALLILTSILRVGHSSFPRYKIDEDNSARIMAVVHILMKELPANDVIVCSYLNSDSESSEENTTLSTWKSFDAIKTKKKKDVNIGDSIQFDFLNKKDSFKQKAADEESLIISGKNSVGFSSILSSSKLSHLVQLTGYSDEIYVEAYVDVVGFDIVLDILIVNLTTNTLSNVNCEFCSGDSVKLVQKAPKVALGPGGFTSIKASFKVSTIGSDSSSSISGCVSFDIPQQGEKVVSLNSIPLEITDYILPSKLSDAEFMDLWVRLEWENKININILSSDLNLNVADDNVDLVVFAENLTKMVKLCSIKENSGTSAASASCGFFAGNYTAKTLFGEDLLVNVSLEKLSGISGHMRIRSHSQGLAYSFGEKGSLTMQEPETEAVICDSDGALGHVQKQLNLLAENQKACLEARKGLAEKTKEFRKNIEEKHYEAFKPLLKAYQMEIDALTKRNQLANNEYGVAAKLIEQQIEAKNIIYAENTDLKVKLDQSKKQLLALDENNRNNENQDSIIARKLHDKENQLRKEFEESSHDQRQKIQDLTKKIEKYEKTKKSLRAANEALQSKLLNEKQQEKNNDQSYDRLNQEFKMIMSDLETTRNHRIYLEKQLEISKQEIQIANDEKERITKEYSANISKMEAEIKKASETIKSLQESLSEMKASNEELKNEINEAKLTSGQSKHDEIIAALENEIAELKLKLKDSCNDAQFINTEVENIAANTSPGSPNSSESLLPIITSQRDRFKKKLLEIEEKSRKTEYELASMKITNESLKNDNIKLFERIDNLLQYAPKSLSFDLEDPSVKKYQLLYEDKQDDPFNDLAVKEFRPILEHIKL